MPRTSNDEIQLWCCVTCGAKHVIKTSPQSLSCWTTFDTGLIHYKLEELANVSINIFFTPAVNVKRQITWRYSLVRTQRYSTTYCLSDLLNKHHCPELYNTSNSLAFKHIDFLLSCLTAKSQHQMCEANVRSKRDERLKVRGKKWREERTFTPTVKNNDYLRDFRHVLLRGGPMMEEKKGGEWKQSGYLCWICHRWNPF